MGPCFTFDQLECLLDGRLDDSQHQAAEDHVEGCLSCQQTLEELAIARDEARGRSRLTSDSIRVAPETSFLRFIKDQGPPSELGSRFEDAISSHRLDMARASSHETEPTAGRRPLPAVAGFRIVREIGRGGMGVVYEAIELALGRRSALKILLAHHASTTAVERFHREARAAAKLHHTNIVPVFGVGEDEGQIYYVMQFIEGESLGQIFDRLSRSAARPGDAGPSPTLPPSTLEAPAPNSNSATFSTEGSAQVFFRTIARIGRKVAEALAYAHKQGVLHRDIKPANLLLDAQGDVWVTDFGLAKAFEGEDGLTQAGDIVGTVRYMAPERFDGRSEPRSDVYALGVTLYELLTLRPLFAESNRTKLIERILHDEPISPRQHDRRITHDLETIVQKAMAKEPAARYASAAALAEDLRRFLAGETILARRAGVPERAWRWTRRNPRLAALLLVVGFLLTGGALGSTLAALRFQRLARSESQAHQQADRMIEAERIARSRADRHAAEAQAVVDFLINRMLVAAYPGDRQGRTVTADEVLTRAGRAIEGRFVDQPLVEASIRHQIALSFFTLGIGTPAAQHAERAREMRAKQLGPEHPLTIDSMLLVAMSLHTAGAYGAACGLAEQVYKARLRTLGPDHVETADALYWVASSINNDPARLEEARSMFVRVLEVYQRTLPPEDPKLTAPRVGLAWTLGCQKRYAESLAVYQELLRIHRRYRGPDDYEAARILPAMAEVLAWSGRRDEAAETYEEALRISSRAQNPGDAWGYSIMDNLLDLRRAQVALKLGEGRPGDSARLIQGKALPICDQRVTRAEVWLARDPRALDVRVNLVVFLAERAAFLAELGRRAEALKDVDRGLAVGEEILFLAETDTSPAGAERSASAVQAVSLRESMDRGAVPLFKIASVYALLAAAGRDDGPQSTRDADRAIELLRTAVARGFRRTDRITENPGFTFLKPRADFRAILESLPWRVAGAIEGEALKVLKTSGPFEVAPHALPEKRNVGRWSGDAILIGSPSQPGDWVELALPVAAQGTYRVVAYLIAAPGHGVVRLSLDGQPQGLPFDGFHLGPDPRSYAILDATPSPVTVDLGTAHLRKGTATLRIEVVGKVEGSQGYSWGLDCLVLRPSSTTTAPEAGRETRRGGETQQ